jgi:hypothetical protein
MRRVLLFPVGLLLAACAYRYSYGTPIQPEDFQKLVAGQTTRSQVLQMWGDPKDILHGPDGRILIYESGVAEEESPVLRTRTLRVRIVLDSKDVLKEYVREHLRSESPLDRARAAEWESEPSESRYPGRR